jgi:transcriptional regulator with XRE-family HTH domain
VQVFGMRTFRSSAASIGLARARQIAAWFGRELRIARVSAGLTQFQLARRAGIAQQEVSRAENGDPSVSLVIRCRLAAACGMQLGWRMTPESTVHLRDSGQLGIAQGILRITHSSWVADLEHIVAPGDLRAADILLSHPVELAQVEIERSLVDFQGQLRAAQLKRRVIAERESRPVRLVIAVPDTEGTRVRIEPNLALIQRVLPVSSRRIWSALKSGEPIGGDGLLFVRRGRLAPPDESAMARSRGHTPRASAS